MRRKFKSTKAASDAAKSERRRANSARTAVGIERPMANPIASLIANQYDRISKPHGKTVASENPRIQEAENLRVQAPIVELVAFFLNERDLERHRAKTRGAESLNS
jgi:hypothetical protein